jgi:hypothetical protein
MIKSKLRKVMASSLIAISLMVLSPIGASAEWRQNRTGWWYEEGDSYATGWKLINGKYYYFSTNGYMLHDTYVEGYQLGSDGAWVVSTPRISTTTTTNSSTANVTRNPVHLQILRGLQTNKNKLSCKYDGSTVDLWNEDDASGRQKWQFVPVNGMTDVYNIRVANGINNNRSYLSTNADGSSVDLWSEDDGSGRQRWRVIPVENNSTFNTYLIQVYGGVSTNKKFLSTNADGTKVDLWYENDGSGRQKWAIYEGELR